VGLALRDGVDHDEIAERYTNLEAGVEVRLPRPPGEIDRLTAVEDLPRYLAIFLAVLAGAAVSFATATTVRRRRADIAVLRVLGMTGRQLRTVVAVVVLALTLAGSIAGSAAGILVGRQVWRAVTGSVALPFAPQLPLAAVVLVPVAGLLLSQLVASVSRRGAGRIPAARVLRTE
jgi:predicted lysophospholipase L1 biosynthesis ABC-type transport system permease subunit